MRRILKCCFYKLKVCRQNNWRTFYSPALKPKCFACFADSLKVQIIFPLFNKNVVQHWFGKKLADGSYWTLGFLFIFSHGFGGRSSISSSSPSLFRCLQFSQTMYKFISLLLTFTLVGQLKAQQGVKFEFWISSLDKAAYDRVTYHVTEKGITIKDGPYDFIYFAKNYKNDKIVFKQKIDSVDKINLYNIASTIYNDTLKSQYTNLCIMDGTIIHFLFEWGDKKTSTTVSNYYLDKVQQFVDFVNKYAPKKYKVYYDKVDLEKLMKDCPKNRILD